MSTRAERLFADMTESCDSKGTFQSSIRLFISDGFNEGAHAPEVAQEIAEVVSQWRSFMEDTYISITDGDAKKERRKTVNNVVNDTSRICKSEINFSIKCTDRKNHVYTAEEYVKPEPKPKDEAAGDAEIPMEPMEPTVDLSNILKGMTSREALKAISEYYGTETFLDAVKDVVTEIKGGE